MTILWKYMILKHLKQRYSDFSSSFDASDISLIKREHLFYQMVLSFFPTLGNTSDKSQIFRAVALPISEPVLDLFRDFV